LGADAGASQGEQEQGEETAVHSLFWLMTEDVV
jgi:hypothetical protein